MYVGITQRPAPGTAISYASKRKRRRMMKRTVTLLTELADDIRQRSPTEQPQAVPETKAGEYSGGDAGNKGKEAGRNSGAHLQAAAVSNNTAQPERNRSATIEGSAFRTSAGCASIGAFRRTWRETHLYNCPPQHWQDTAQERVPLFDAFGFRWRTARQTDVKLPVTWKQRGGISGCECTERRVGADSDLRLIIASGKNESARNHLRTMQN